MSGLNFKTELDKEFNEIIEKGNKAVIKVAKGMHKVAVAATAPRDTGRAESSWKLTNGQRSGLIPAMGNYGSPRTPVFKFDFKKDAAFSLLNNVPYISFLEHGQGRGRRTPRRMMHGATAYFNDNMQREFDRIR